MGWLVEVYEAQGAYAPAYDYAEGLLELDPYREEALRALQRCSLIERQERGFGLQNVVIEHLTDRLVETIARELETKTLDLLHRHAVLKAQAKEYVRQSQARLILTPLGDRLLAKFGRTGLADYIRQVVARLRQEAAGASSYAGGNILKGILCYRLRPVLSLPKE